MSDNIESKIIFKKSQENFFNIERCPTMGAIGEGVKTCEFLIRQARGTSTRLFLIEAKESAPKPPSVGGAPDRWEKYGTAVYEKMVNSLLVYVGLKTGRPYASVSELPRAMADDALGAIRIIPCLVLPDHPEWALVDVQNELRMRLNHIVKSFRLELPIAINYEIAFSIGLAEERVS